MSLNNPIRDIRESKNLSQDAVAAACGITYSVFYRVEAGSGKTTQDEVDKVVKVLNKMKPGTRKVVGRPFGDPKIQQAVQKARESGGSVASALGASGPSTPAAEKPTTKKAAKRAASPAKKRRSKKAEDSLI